MQFQEKNTVRQNVNPGEHGSASKTLIVVVDRWGRVVSISETDIDNGINFPGDPGLFLDGTNNFSKATSVFDYLMFWQDGRVVLDQQLSSYLFQNAH